MSKKLPVLFLACVCTFCIALRPYRAFAWGPEGHTIVAKIAFQYLTPEVKENVLAVLNGMPLDTAANWMDIMKSNADYEFMRVWHYIDFDQDKQYEPSTDENIINRLIITFNELRHKKTLCSDQIKTDLLILLHLMGDLHQPLHTGYLDDKGGNSRAVQYDTLKTNLHSFWDVDIIRLNDITVETVMQTNVNDTIAGIHPVKWMKETRSLLNHVYDFSGFELSPGYLKKNDVIVKRQLFIAGLRLAAMLNKLFVSTAPVVDMKAVTAKYKDGIDIQDALKYKGKTVTVCARVFGVKNSDKVSFLNLGAKYPNSPLTVVIFANDRKKFLAPIDEMFNDQNVCVKGEIVEYQGKAEIIVTKPEDIIIQ